MIEEYILVQQLYIYSAVTFCIISTIRIAVAYINELCESRDQLLTRIQDLEDKLANSRPSNASIPPPPPLPPVLLPNTKLQIPNKKSEPKVEIRESSAPTSFDSVLKELVNKPRRSMRFESPRKLRIDETNKRKELEHQSRLNILKMRC